MKLRTSEPWLPADDYGRSLTSLSLNLLVHDVASAVQFQQQVLGAELVYADVDFAVMRACDAEWMIHADHTYDAHPIHQLIAGNVQRGIGVEIRLHGCDPDQAVEKAQQAGVRVLAMPKDKGHGVREAYIMDLDGFVWVPDVPIGKTP